MEEESCHDDAKPDPKNDRSHFELAFAERASTMAYGRAPRCPKGDGWMYGVEANKQIRPIAAGKAMPSWLGVRGLTREVADCHLHRDVCSREPGSDACYLMLVCASRPPPSSPSPNHHLASHFHSAASCPRNILPSLSPTCRCCHACLLLLQDNFHRTWPADVRLCLTLCLRGDVGCRQCCHAVTTSARVGEVSCKLRRHWP